LQERLTAAVTEAVAAAEAAADEAQQQIRALQEEASGLRATNTALHTALEEVHAAAASYQVRCSWLPVDCTQWCISAWHPLLSVCICMEVVHANVWQGPALA
jgi:hypothetical protein